MTNKGWVKIHKNLLDSPVWKYSIHAGQPHLISLWLYILLSVNWEPKKWYDGKSEIEIPAGSWVTSQKQLSEGLSLSRTSIRTCLKHLENMQMITTRVTNKWTQIYVVKWSKFQSKEVPANQQDNHTLNINKTSTRHQLDTTKEYKNIRSKEYIYKPSTQELEEIASKYNVPLGLVEFKLESLNNYMASNGKQYKNPMAALKNFVLEGKKDALERGKKDGKYTYTYVGKGN